MLRNSIWFFVAKFDFNIAPESLPAHNTRTRPFLDSVARRRNRKRKRNEPLQIVKQPEEVSLNLPTPDHFFRRAVIRNELSSLFRDK